MRKSECGMRNVRVGFDERMPVYLERVPLHDAQPIDSAFRIPHSDFGRQPGIPLHSDNPCPAGEQDLGQRAVSRTYFSDCLAGRTVQRVDNAVQDSGVSQEMLAEALVRPQALSRTRVRSSVAGAPPVKAAMSVKTASRISRAGRLRRFVT